MPLFALTGDMCVSILLLTVQYFAATSFGALRGMIWALTGSAQLWML